MSRARGGRELYSTAKTNFPRKYFSQLPILSFLGRINNYVYIYSLRRPCRLAGLKKHPIRNFLALFLYGIYPFVKCLEVNKLTVPEFTFEGCPVYELPSILNWEGEEQLKEMDRRLRALYEWSRDNDLPMSYIHIRNALGVSNKTFERYKYEKTTKKAENVTEADRELMRARAAIIEKWYMLGDGAFQYKVNNDSIPSRSIYINKSLFQHSDNPEQTKSGTAITLEVVLAQRDKRKREGK